MGWNGRDWMMFAGLAAVGWRARMTDWQGIIRWALPGAVAIVLGLGCSGAAEPAPQAQPAAVPPTAPTVVGPVDDLPAVFGRGLSLPDVPLPAVPVPDAPDLSGRFSEAASGLSGLVSDSVPDVSGGIAESLPSGLESAEGWLELDLSSPERAAVIRELGWVSDGVDGVEAGMVDWLVWTAIDYGEVFDRVVRSQWLSDGVTSQEIQVMKRLYFLAVSDLGFALWLLGQPFLETVEYADAPAVESLLKVQTLVPEQADLVQALLLATGGVTNGWAPIVAMTWPVARFDPDELNRLYDPSVVRVHTKLIDLGQSGETLLAVVRTEPGAGETLELVESIVREVEGTMGRPLPLDYVGALFGDAVSPGAIGINYGTGMVLEPRFDVADGSYDAERLRGVLAHEAAHYWWNGNENWIDEGMAEFVAAASYGFPDGRGYPLLREPCGEARSLSELPPEPRESIRCDYSLGQRMFFSLYRVLGEDRFYEGARALYDQSRADMFVRSLNGTPAGVAEVREAFGPEGSEAIDRWYDGKGERDLNDF